jgi:hypothetical protein
MKTLSNNRLSVTITDDTLSLVKSAFASINESLPFLVKLNKYERMFMTKINDSNKQFVQGVLNVMNDKPLYPTYMNPEELHKDLILFSQLEELVSMAQQLTEKLRDTQILAGSEAYLSAISVFGLIEAASRDGMPGADIAYSQLADLGTTNMIPSAE